MSARKKTEKLEIIFSTPGEPDRVEVLNVEAGTKERIARLREEMEKSWCKCGDKETFGRYPNDGECSCGTYKHHVHCGTCGKVSQVG